MTSSTLQSQNGSTVIMWPSMCHVPQWGQDLFHNWMHRLLSGPKCQSPVKPGITPEHWRCGQMQHPLLMPLDNLTRSMKHDTLPCHSESADAFTLTATLSKLLWWPAEEKSVFAWAHSSLLKVSCNGAREIKHIIIYAFKFSTSTRKFTNKSNSDIIHDDKAKVTIKEWSSVWQSYK